MRKRNGKKLRSDFCLSDFARKLHPSHWASWKDLLGRPLGVFAKRWWLAFANQLVGWPVQPRPSRHCWWQPEIRRDNQLRLVGYPIISHYLQVFMHPNSMIHQRMTVFERRLGCCECKLRSLSPISGIDPWSTANDYTRNIDPMPQTLKAIAGRPSVAMQLHTFRRPAGRINLKWWILGIDFAMSHSRLWRLVWTPCCRFSVHTWAPEKKKNTHVPFYWPTITPLINSG